MTKAQMSAALVAGAALLVVLATGDPALHVLAVAVAGITAFATRSLPEAPIAILIFLALLAIDAAPHGVIFSGFAASGFWLLVGGLIMGSAISSSGLGDQIAARIHRFTGGSCGRAVWFLSLTGLVLGALVPSAIPRVIVMMPITLALAERMQMPTGSRAQTGLLMTSAMMTLAPTYAFLTANLPTIVEIGIMDLLYGVEVTYGAYFVLNAPLNLVRFGVLLVMLLGFCRGARALASGDNRDGVRTPWTAAQIRLSVILIAAVLLWATDTWHGVNPAWITVGAALVLLLPQVGVFGAQAMKTEIDLSIAFLIAAVFSISAVITETGLAQQIARVVVPALNLAPGDSLWNLLVIVAASCGLSHLTIAPATPIVLVPLAEAMGAASGWSLDIVAMAHNVGFSTTVLPYQSPPLLIALAVARIPLGALTRLCLVSALITSLLGLPLTWLWWQWLGVI